jgi:nicotinate-nucleotide adenylyltransferase
MLRAALKDSDGFITDDREFLRDGVSYTVDTLGSFRDEFPDRSLCLMIGMDAFFEFDTWHRWQDILKLAHLVVACRPGTAVAETAASGELLARHGAKDPADLQQEKSGRILVHAVTQLEVSSSAIREIIGGGSTARFLVPEVVTEIIEASGCYSAKNENKN